MSLKNIENMNRKEEILYISQRLTEFKLKRKMVEWSFMNSKDLPEETVNSILDEKTRLEKLIAAFEKRLKELEK